MTNINPSRKISGKIDVDPIELQKESTKLSDETTNLRNSVILLRSDIEREVKLLFSAQKGIESMRPSFRTMVMRLLEGEIIDRQMANSILIL